MEVAEAQPLAVLWLGGKIEKGRVRGWWGGLGGYGDRGERKGRGREKGKVQEEGGREKQGESRRPHARSWVGIIVEDHGIFWPPYVYKGSSQMTVLWHTGHWSRVSFPMGKISLSLHLSVSLPSLSFKITQFLFLSISLPLISLLSSLVPCYPINSLPQCLSSLVLIIKLDLLQVARGKTNSQCRHQTDNALQLTFVFSITCGLGNRCHTPTQAHAHMCTRVA